MEREDKGFLQEWINKKAQERVRDEMMEGDNEKNEVIEISERAEKVKDGGVVGKASSVVSQEDIEVIKETEKLNQAQVAQVPENELKTPARTSQEVVGAVEEQKTQVESSIASEAAETAEKDEKEVVLKVR